MKSWVSASSAQEPYLCGMENNQQPKRQRGQRVSTHHTVTEPDELMTFLVAQLPHKNRSNIKSLLGNKQILIDGKVFTQFNHPLAPGQVVTVAANRAPRNIAVPGPYHFV